MVRTDRGDTLLTANEAAMDAIDIDHLFGGEDDNGDLLDVELLNFDVDELGVEDLPAPDSMFDYISMDGGLTIENPEMLQLDDKKTITRTARGYSPELAKNNNQAASTENGTTRTNAKMNNTSAQEASGVDEDCHQPGRDTSKRTRKRKTQHAEITDATMSTSLSNMKYSTPLDIKPTFTLKRKTKNQRTLPIQRQRKSITGHDETSAISASTMGHMLSFHRSNGNTPTTRKPNQDPPVECDYAFFPFTNVPPNDLEPLHTIYPNLYRVFSSSSPEGPNIASHQNTNGSAILNLLVNFVGTSIEISQGQFNPNDADSLKNRDIDVLADEASINKCKRYMSESVEKKVLIGELRRLLDQVKGQQRYLTKQMCQMTYWCKDKFNDMQNGAPSSSDFFPSTAKYAHSVGVSQDVIDGLMNVSNLIPLSLKVKIKCVGFKKSDTAPLDAVIIPIQGTNPSLIFCGVPIIHKQKKARTTITKIPSARKKKEKASPPPRPPMKSTKPAKSVVVKNEKRTYDEKSPAEKHKIVAKILKERSLEFEQKLMKADAERQRGIKARNKKLTDIIDQHTDREMASDQFWEMVPLFSYWDEKSKEEIDNDLSTIWQPELSTRAMQWSEPPTPVILKSQNSEKSLNAKQNNSLFNRLQSLLVEERESDEEVQANGINDGEVSDDDSMIEAHSQDQENAKPGLVDLSELILDQRVYIHLRSTHLLDQPLLKSLVPAVVETNDIFDNDRSGRDEIVSAVRTKQIELSKLHKANNSKLSLLRSISLDKCSKGRNHDRSEIMDTQNNGSAEADADEWVPS